jgi:hypothetical protein
MAIRLAQESRGQVGETKWSGWFDGRMEGAAASAAMAAPKPARRRKAADIPTELENPSTEGDATLAELAPAEPPGRTGRSTSAASAPARSRRSTAAAQAPGGEGAAPADAPSKPSRSRASAAADAGSGARASRKRKTVEELAGLEGAASAGSTETGEAPAP